MLLLIFDARLHLIVIIPSTGDSGFLGKFFEKNSWLFALNFVDLLLLENRNGNIDR